MRKFESYIIANFPYGAVRRLRKLRGVRDYLRGLIFKMFGAPKKFYPYAAKYFSSVQSRQATTTHTPHEEWGDSFTYYRKPNSQSKTQHLVWADTPIPGNYGDWLSPYIFEKYTRSRVHHLSPIKRPDYPHFVGLGSIISSANAYSHVVGAGIGRLDEKVDVRAKFQSVRGPYTAERIKKLGGPLVEVFGDPGFLLPQIYKPTKHVEKQHEVLLVRHINHRQYPFPIANQMAELSILAAQPKRIEHFIDEILGAKLVVTSAMHCLITCIAYGIPCILFKPEIDDVPVPGDGIKYRDTLAGVGLPEISPVKLRFDRDFLASVRDIQPYKEPLRSSEIRALEATYKSISNL